MVATTQKSVRPVLGRWCAPLAALSVVLAVQAGGAEASVVVHVTQSGDDVVFDGSGTLNLAALTLNTSDDSTPAMRPVFGFFMVGADVDVSQEMDFYDGINGPADFGTGEYIQPDAGTGDRFGVGAQGTHVSVPAGYTSGSPLAGTMTFANTSLAALGLTPGTYVWEWGDGLTADALTLIIPEPATAALLTLTLPLLRRSTRR